MNCEFCNNSFCSKSNLIHHQWNAIYCIQKRNEELKELRILVQKQQETIETNKGKLLEKETAIIDLEAQIASLTLEIADELVLEDNNPILDFNI
jgi:hypothetical protein